MRLIKAVKKVRDFFRIIKDVKKSEFLKSLKYYVTDDPIRSGTQYLDFEEYVSLHSM